jgi:hypothetical protein
VGRSGFGYSEGGVGGVYEEIQVGDEWFEWFGPARALGYGGEGAELTHY